jgi:hypothetical protein
MSLVLIVRTIEPVFVSYKLGELSHGKAWRVINNVGYGMPVGTCHFAYLPTT